MPQLSPTSTLKLPNNLTIPRLGFGVYQSPADVCVNSCLTALKNGYRHIDTAQFYANETQVGEAVKQSGIPRSEIFLTTKILSASGSVEKSYQKCVASVNKIDKDGYVDLFLIHSPNAGSKARKEMWLALEKLHAEGKAKSIGVSNFGIGHIKEMKEYATVWPPHANQIELHPWCQQTEIVHYCNENGIVIEAYCPLVRNYKANDPTLLGLAKKHGKTTAQVLVRWSLQKGWSTLPKSDNPERIKANADVFGFELDESDMKELHGVDEGAAGALVQAVDNE
jgi:diketogulonate reductase-like aldo/keto reductase